MYETSCQSRFDARYWMLGAGALGRPKGMVWGGRREEGSGWGREQQIPWALKWMAPLGRARGEGWDRQRLISPSVWWSRPL